MTEILDSFWGAMGILTIVAVIYAVFRLEHPYSEKAKGVIGAHLTGCLTDAGAWFMIVVVASQLAIRSPTLWYIFIRILDTSFFNVTFVTWSMLLVPLSFSVHKAYGRYDYRGPAIGVLCAIALILGFYYWVRLAP
jgi:hypothetical protein